MYEETVFDYNSSKNGKGYIGGKRQYLETEEIVETYIENNVEMKHRDLIKQILLHHETLIENECLKNVLKDFTKFKDSFQSNKRLKILNKKHTLAMLEQNETVILFVTFLIREMRFNSVAIHLHLPTRSIQEKRLNVLTEVLRGTETRSNILQKANSIKTSELTDVRLYNLFEDLVQSENVVWKQILVVFFFSADLMVRSIRQSSPYTFNCILKWSLHYFETTLTDFVYNKGGWSCRENSSKTCDCSIWLRTCNEEITGSSPTKIIGEIPKWLKGSLYRNGPGRLKFGDDEFQHIFDCSALLHCYAFNNGKVNYSCKFLQSNIYTKNIEANRIMMTEFGTKSIADPCNTIFHRIASLFRPQDSLSDNAMISVYPFSDDLFAFGEGPIIHKINKDTLHVEQTVDMYQTVGVVNHTSHPHIETDGSVYNLGMKIEIDGPVHKIVCFPKGLNSKTMFEKAYIVGSVKAKWRFYPSYMHTFGITPNYFILVQQPLSTSIFSLIKCKLVNDPLIKAFQWFGAENTVINVICRKSGNCVKTYHAKAFFFLHIINQYEEGDHIVIDICSYNDPSMLECMYIEALKNMENNERYAEMFRSKPIRFILPLKSKDITFVEPEILCNIGCETPRINYEHFLGRKYQFFYAINADVDATNPSRQFAVAWW